MLTKSKTVLYTFEDDRTIGIGIFIHLIEGKQYIIILFINRFKKFEMQLQALVHITSCKMYT